MPGPPLVRAVVVEPSGCVVVVSVKPLGSVRVVVVEPSAPLFVLVVEPSGFVVVVEPSGFFWVVVLVPSGRVSVVVPPFPTSTIKSLGSIRSGSLFMPIPKGPTVHGNVVMLVRSGADRKSTRLNS